MNIGTDGQRYIAYMNYTYKWNNDYITKYAQFLKDYYDEVYIINFNANEAFIYEVVLKGCRV